MSAIGSAQPGTAHWMESFDIAPMSAAQRQLWFLQAMNPECRAYNIAAVLRIRGTLVIDALRAAIPRLVERQEALRTTFGLDDGKPVQKIAAHAPPVEMLCGFQDVEALPSQQQAGAIKDLVRREAARAFDLEQGPLFFCHVLRRAVDDHILLVTLHHIISDGWSIGILIRELKELYAAEAAGAPAALPELPIQYADYAVWQQQRFENGDMESQAAWWTRELQGAPTVLHLPSDRHRPAVQSFRGAQFRLDFDIRLTAQLKQFGRQEQATLFMTLIAGFAVLLYRYTGQTDLLIGTPVANRPQKELHGLIGCFVNAIVIRVQLGATVTFREVARQVRRTSIEAFEHQELPFEQLVQRLGITPEPSRNPLFQVMFLLQNNERPEPSAAGLQIEECDGRSASSRFDLSLSMEEIQGGLSGFWEYSSDLFEPETIRRMTAHFQALMAGLLREPDQPVSTVPYLDEQEIAQIENWNATARPYAISELAHQLFERRASEFPDNRAVLQGNRAVTYRELNARANWIAARLKAEGIGVDDLVGICSERSIEWIAGLLGVLKAGAGYVSLDPRYPADRLRFMIEEAKPRVALVGKGLAALFEGSGVTLWILGDEDASSAAELNPAPMGRPDSAAYVVYTSGSTGRPKAVVVCHRALLNLIQWHTRTYHVKADGRASQFARMGFDASVWEIWPYLAVGASVHIVDEQDRLSPKEVQRFLIENEITVGFLPPVVAESLISGPWPGNTRLRALLTGSDRLVAYPAEGLPFRYYNHYGPTEAAVIVTAGPVDPTTDANVPPSIGRPVDNTQILLLDDNLELTPVLRTAELYIGGDALARGYLNQPKLTAEKFVPNPYGPQPGARMYRTGDLARYRATGELDFIGRNDRQVKIRGFRVELGEIEAVLCRQPGIESAAVVLRESAGHDQLAAYLIAHGPRPSDATLRAAMRQALPEFMVPTAFVYLDEFPLSPNGKLRREALPAPEDLPTPAREMAAPRGELEEKLASIWREVLGVPEVGIHDNFFDVGGQSVKAVQVQDMLEQRLGVKAPIVELFRNPTIAELAQYLGASETSAQPVATGESRAVQRKEMRERGRRRPRGSQEEGV